ncbi:MAG TPA: hypothetical protein VGO16_12315 [Pseudonocardiaceae bacterium]|jgi:hypothetical protein|nr:hypothetical protein [Pseudonocardiaceae bacterium]
MQVGSEIVPGNLQAEATPGAMFLGTAWPLLAIPAPQWACIIASVQDGALDA